MQHTRRMLCLLAVSIGTIGASVAAAAPITASPDPTALPDTQKLQQLINGAYAWALIAVFAALIVAAGMWAWGAQANNVRATSDGRRGVIVALVAALVLGAAPTLVNWAYGFGR